VRARRLMTLSLTVLGLLSSERPYSPASSIVTALEELRRCAGSQFDPEVVERFRAVVTRPAAARRPHQGPRRAAAASPRG
jgi:HD-GYP domain-containing protein (c-di-GMP phosphodiesterase class II)